MTKQISHPDISWTIPRLPKMDLKLILVAAFVSVCVDDPVNIPSIDTIRNEEVHIITSNNIGPL